MDFNSVHFFLFLLLFIPAYYILPWRLEKALKLIRIEARQLQNFILLVGCLYFVSTYSIKSFFILATTTVLNFYFAKFIDEIHHQGIKKIIFYISIILNITLLLLIKFIEFSDTGFDIVFHPITFTLERVVIAAGFSFYMLQSISYLTDVYRQEIKHETDFVDFAVYQSFFPKLLLGPIELAQNFLPQLKRNRYFNIHQFSLGFQRILFGLFKKLVLADRIAPGVNAIFDSPDHFAGLTTLTGVYLFTIRMYFDFSGYTDIAIGVSKILGFDLKENFNQPFKSTSITEFWRRWHISLIDWLTHYLYYPIVFYFRGKGKYAILIGIAATFLFSGIWHGMGITFLIWSVLNIIYISYELLSPNWKYTPRFKISKLTRSIFVFQLVCFANLFFRSPSFERATKIIGDIFWIPNFIPKSLLSDYISPLANGGQLENIFNLSLSALLIILFFKFETRFIRIIKGNDYITWFSILMILLIMMTGIFNSGEQFIYLQF